MGKLEDYIDYYTRYKKLYGDKFALFYQIGKFHELYGVDNAQEKICNVTEIAGLLNIKETRVDTSILENTRANPQMAGFNSVCLDRNVDLLVDQGYTVVVVNQKVDCQPIEREVAFIASPSTTVHGTNDPYIVSVYIDLLPNKKGTPFRYIGMAALDITTGKSYTAETCGLPADFSRADDDLNRFLQTYAPVEVLLNYPPAIEASLEVDRMIAGWGYRKAHSGGTCSELKPVVYLNIDPIQPAYLETCLADFYPASVRGHLKPVEYVGLTQMPQALMAFVQLLRFLVNHNRDALNILPPPQLYQDDGSLILDTNALLQLDLLDSFYAQQKRDTVYAHMACRLLTAMGRRLMRERLTNPVTDPVVLLSRYAAIRQMGDDTAVLKPDTIVASVAPRESPTHYRVGDYIVAQMTSMRDLDRFHRKIALGTLTPAEFYFLATGGYAALERLLTALLPLDPSLNRCRIALQRITANYADRIDLEAAGKCTVLENVQGTIFQQGYNTELDALTTALKTDEEELNRLTAIFSGYIQAGSEGCKYREDLEGGGYFTLSKPAWTKFKKNFQTVRFWDAPIAFGDLHADDRNKSNVKFTVPVITAYADRRIERLVQLRGLTARLFGTFLKSFHLLAEDLEIITRTLSEFDLQQGMYRLTQEFGYVCPEIVPAADSTAGCSFVNAQGLRHPVVERRCNYVAQDIRLGGGATADDIAPADGILLYGVNQTGKSCTMKSVGVAVVLAQAGFYVPATRFQFRPYRNIMTRILSNDNMANGLSTFAVEMVELRSILTRCHGQTLILGDEVCHGTESASAVSLVAAAVIHMAHQRSTFIFATHLHELSNMVEITGLPNVAQCHLSVSFQGEQIIYDRYMKPGSGLGRYGIEVAKFLKLPPDVLHTAYTIRNKYYTEPETLQSSRYNRDFILHKCAICAAPAKDAHHILFQAESNEQGLIAGRIKKNNPGNLVGLCAQHHAMVHGPGPEELIIFGYHPGGALHYSIRPRLASLNGRTITSGI
jgi:DNA mismatch repair protein MutS